MLFRKKSPTCARCSAGIFTLIAAVLSVGPASPATGADVAKHVFNIREHGAVGDGANLDSRAINDAIDACAKAGGGQVLFPAGRYSSGTIHLRSHVTLFLEAGATLVGTTNLAEYQQPVVPANLPEARWGKWHRALIVGENLEDVSICGPGTIDGNRVFDPTGEEKMRGPHTLNFVNCKGFLLRDVSIVDAANYAIFFQVSDDVEIRNVKITGGWDGVHFRGAPDRWCTNVNVIGCQFYTGDDSIAGRYWVNTVISDCILNSACNGIRLIGPATHLLIDNCLFFGPGTRPHRTSGPLRRANMLSGICLQPGGWDRTEGILDDVLISRTTMHHVASPLTFTMKRGNTAGRITVNDLNATGVYRAAMSIESWADAPITNMVVRNARIEFDGGGTAEQARQSVRSPPVDARSLPAWGLYARNVQRLDLEDVRFSLAHDDFRPVVLAENVNSLTLDNFQFPIVAGVERSFATNQVERLTIRGTTLRP
jgi:hypothetical protein